jgi:hypothetical protein
VEITEKKQMSDQENQPDETETVASVEQVMAAAAPAVEEDLPSHVPFVRTRTAPDVRHMLYRCCDAACRAVDRMKVLHGDPIPAKIVCWKCRSGYGVDEETLITTKTLGMIAVGWVSGENTPEEDAVTVRPLDPGLYPQPKQEAPRPEMIPAQPARRMSVPSHVLKNRR